MSLTGWGHRSVPGCDGAPIAGAMAHSDRCLHSFSLCLYSCWVFFSFPKRWSLQHSHPSGTEMPSTWLCGLLLRQAAPGIHPVTLGSPRRGTVSSGALVSMLPITQQPRKGLWLQDHQEKSLLEAKPSARVSLGC